MTTINEAREACYERWRSVWGSTTPYAFEGEVYTPPAADPHVLFRVLNTDSAQETLGAVGNRRFLRHASVVLTLKVQDGKGIKSLDVLAQQARAIFEGVSFSGLRFFAALPPREQPSDGKWKPTVVEIPFDYEERK